MIKKAVGRPALHDIPLDQIEIGDRLRAVDDTKLDMLAASMGGENNEKTKLIQPIILHAKSLGGYRLVVGAHRVEAARRLQWKTITAMIVSGLTANELRILEIDENLHRIELCPGDRAEFSTMKIRLMLAKDGRKNLPSISELNDNREIAQAYRDVAELAGFDVETIRLDVRRRKQLDHVWTALKGTSAWNSGLALDRLRKKFSQNADEVVAIAQRDHDGNIEAAMDALAGPKSRKKVSVTANQAMKALVKAWNNSPRSAREKFISENREEISAILQTI